MNILKKLLKEKGTLDQIHREVYGTLEEYRNELGLDSKEKAGKFIAQIYTRNGER